MASGGTNSTEGSGNGSDLRRHPAFQLSHLSNVPGNITRVFVTNQDKIVTPRLKNPGEATVMQRMKHLLAYEFYLDDVAEQHRLGNYIATQKLIHLMTSEERRTVIFGQLTKRPELGDPDWNAPHWLAELDRWLRCVPPYDNDGSQMGIMHELVKNLRVKRCVTCNGLVTTLLMGIGKIYKLYPRLKRKSQSPTSKVRRAVYDRLSPPSFKKWA